MGRRSYEHERVANNWAGRIDTESGLRTGEREKEKTKKGEGQGRKEKRKRTVNLVLKTAKTPNIL
jgi:hypothetical protein